MPATIRDRIDQLLAALIPLSLLFACGIALWLGSTAQVDSGPRPRQAPFFQYTFPGAPEKIFQRSTPELHSGGREPFHKEQSIAAAPVVAPAENQLDLQEVLLSMVAIAAGRKTCLANGQILREGDQRPRFRVKSITDQGVLFASSKEQFFLQIGQQVTIDQQGVIHAIQQQKPAAAATTPTAASVLPAPIEQIRPAGNMPAPAAPPER